VAWSSAGDRQLFCEVKDNKVRLCVDGGERGKIWQTAMPSHAEDRDSKARLIASDAIDARSAPLALFDGAKSSRRLPRLCLCVLSLARRIDSTMLSTATGAN
jgi:hypothetical protein